MGGKQKQAQRTKNNARPSNSGRSAELLGASLPQFASFAGMKEAGFSMTTFSLTPVDEFDSTVDSNFQLVLKKMNKKDATTKLKALQEYSDLIRTTDEETIKGILPFWPRLYCTLSTDTDHRVREATHVAQKQVALKAKRDLAPYLKQLVGPWFTSQYDTYAPASTAATQAFQEAFPTDTKFQAAIVYCQHEILNYICDNLTMQSAQSLKNSKNLSADECKAKFERILISSLHGYALYLNKLPQDSLKNAEESNRRIIGDAKFWKLSRHENSHVRAAWFGVLTALCQKASFLIVPEIANVVKAVFVNLDEQDPAVQTSVWEATLLTITTFDDWWKHININELLLPKLWKVLKEAGQGSATVIYPNLLPLLSHMPPTIDPVDFYPKFFNNMRIGLEQKSVKASQSESRVISISLIECLQYVILKNQSNEDLCTDLIKANLIPVLEYSIDNGQNAYRTLFNQIASLIQYWHRNRRHPDLINYQNYAKLFWNLVINLLQSQIITYMSTYEGGDANERISRQIEFLICLKHTNKAKKVLKVQFTESTDKSFDVSDSKDNSNPDEMYLIALSNLISTICESYIKAVNQFKVSSLIDNIYSLLQDFESADLLDYINVNVALGSKTTGLIEIYNNILLNWITDGDLFTRTIVDVIFLLFKYLKPEEKSMVLKSLIGLQYQGIDPNNWNDCLCGGVARALSHPHNLDMVVRDWLSHEHVGKYLVGIMKKIIDDECSTDESLLLKKAFTETDEDGELFISSECISDIITVITSCLLSPSDYLLTIDMCASLSAYIAAILYSESGVQSLDDTLLITLFKFSCNNNVDPDCLSKDTIWEVNTAWQDAVTTLSAKIDKTDIDKLTEKFASILEIDFLSGNINEISTREFARQIFSYIGAINKSMPLHVGCTMNLFFNRSFLPEWKEFASHAIKSAEYVKGNLILSSQEIANIKTDTDYQDSLIKYFLWKEIVTNVLAMQLDNDDYCDDDEDANDKSLVVKVTDETELLIYSLLEDMGQAEYLISNYKNIKHYKKIEELHQSIKEQLTIILEYLDETTTSKLENIINKNVNKDGNVLEVNTAYIYNVDMNGREPAEIYENILKNVEESRNLARLHLTQRFGKHLSYDNLCQKMNTFERVVSLRCLTHCNEIEVQIAEVYNRIEHVRNEEYKNQFYNVNFSNWEQTQMIIEIIQLCTKLIEVRKIAQLSRRHWDFIVVSLGTWSARINENKGNHQNIQIALFITSISKLFSAAQSYLDKLAEIQPDNSYVDEWNNVFVQSITTDLIKTWLYVAEKYGNKDVVVPFTKLPFLQEFGKVINSINPNYIFKTRVESMPKWSKLLKQSCVMLTSHVHCMQLWGYHMLITLSSGLTEVDSLSVDANKPHENGMIFEQFKGLLVETHDIVKNMLLDFRLGEDSCRVEPFTDSYTYTFAYLLIWDVLLNLCEKSSTELKYQYSDWLRKEDLLSCLLSSIFKLLPSEVLHYFDGRVKPLYEWFLQKCPLNLDDSISSEKIERMVCWVYSSALSQLPVSVRQWWKDVETRNSRIVERVTSAYVSPHLCLEELKNVTEHESKFRNMVIKVHPAIREVVAIYTVDDSHMELVITLPLNYPLCGPKVECGRQISGTPHKQWLMQLEMCVTHQNGHIWDALSLWNSNLDRKFDGVEECYICFAVLHPGTFQLPKLGCRTCRKKFHAACLYKWFSTSNKSTCPTCRNLF